MGLKYRITNKIQGSIRYNEETIKNYIVVDELDAPLIDFICKKYVTSEIFEVDEIKEIFKEEYKKNKKKDKNKEDEEDKKILDED